MDRFSSQAENTKWRQTRDRMDRDAQDIRNEESDRKTVLEAYGGDFLGAGRISLF